MKKLLAMLLAIVMIVGLMAACNGGDETKPSETPTQGGSAENPTQGAADVPTEPTRANEERYGGHLDVCIQSNPTGLDPNKQTGTWKYIWTDCVYENALTRDAEDKIAPGVCDYELSEDMLTLKLWPREGITFHDGTPVEAEDVLASIKRACSMNATRQKVIVDVAESMTIEGNVLTIKFKEYKEQTLYYLAAWQTWIAVMPKEICEKYGTDPITFEVADAIGTGPYKITGIEEGNYVTVEKYEGYVPYENGRSGFAGPKYGYMDSISFWYNPDYANSAIAVMNGDYDMNDEISAENMVLAEPEGIVSEMYDSNIGLSLYFNLTSATSPVAKYPDLRKAIIAAFDYSDFLDVQSTPGVYKLTGNPVLSPEYATDIFDKADYASEAQNLELSKKYQEAAKAAGWDPETEPVVICVNANMDAQATMWPKFLRDAGIPYELKVMEAGAYTETVNNKEGEWSFKFGWPTLATTPTLLPAAMISTNYVGAEKDAILAEMATMQVGSDEYIAKWHELAQQMVDDCASVNLGILNWRWFHHKTLHIEDEGLVRYVYNCWWEDPENHPD